MSVIAHLFARTAATSHGCDACQLLWLTLLATITLLAAGGAAQAQSAVNQAVAISRDLDQLNKHLASETAQQMREGESKEARTFLQQSEKDLQAAMTALQSGDFETASTFAANGLRAYKVATEALYTASKSPQELARENSSLRSEIDSYYQAFLAALRSQGPSSAGLLDQQQLDDLLKSAEKLTTAGDHREAQRILRQAHQITIGALTRMRQQETVVYSLEFRTPADEYRYERDRYRDYLQLSKQMLESDTASEGKKKLFQRYLQEGIGTAKLADEQAKGGNHEVAIKGMEDANNSLIRGLQLLGLPVSR